MTNVLTTELLWELPRVGPPSASADGSVVVVPISTHDGTASTTRLWRLQPDGAMTALTSAAASASAPAVSPDGTHVAFVRAVDGRPQAHVLPLSGGEARCVTDLALGLVGSARWADDRRLLVVTRLLEDDPTTEATALWRDAADERPDVLVTERRLSRMWDTWYVDPLTEHVLLVDLDEPDAAPRDLTPGLWLLPDPLEDAGDHAAMSPDGRWLAFTSAHPDGDEDGMPTPRLHVVPVDGSAPVRCLTADQEGPAGPPSFLPDGRIVVAVRTERLWYAAPSHVLAIDPADGTTTHLLDEPDELHGVSVAADGRIILAVEIRARGQLLELVDGVAVPLAAPATGGVGAPVATTGGVFALHASATAPPEIARVDRGAITMLTSVARDQLQDADLGRLEERTVVGGDGDDVQVFVLHPPTTAVSDAGPPPLVHLIHGGPHGTFGDTWHWRWCAARWAAEGWVVAMVNFHGSTSFGHDFTKSIEGDWATLPAADVLAATDDLIADGTVDPERMAIAGGSYGGYLTTWLATQTDRFAVGVAHAAVTDLAGMMASDWLSGLERSFGGWPWAEPEAVAKHSPASHYGGMSTPMLVLHGERDLRVPIDQGRALYGALQTLRIPSRFVVFPGENHWVLDRRASERWYGEVLGWLHRWLDAG